MIEPSEVSPSLSAGGGLKPVGEIEIADIAAVSPSLSAGGGLKPRRVGAVEPS